MELGGSFIGLPCSKKYLTAYTSSTPRCPLFRKILMCLFDNDNVIVCEL